MVVPLESVGVVHKGSYLLALLLQGHHTEGLHVLWHPLATLPHGGGRAAAVEQAIRQALPARRAIMWTAGNTHSPLGDWVVDAEGTVLQGEEEEAIAAVLEAQARFAVEAGEEEVAFARDGGDVRVGTPAGAGWVEMGPRRAVAAIIRGEEADEGRRGMALAEAAEELGVGGDAAPAAGDERGLGKGRRRREAEQDLPEDVVVVEGVGDGGCICRALLLSHQR